MRFVSALFLGALITTGCATQNARPTATQKRFLEARAHLKVVDNPLLYYRESERKKWSEKNGDQDMAAGRLARAVVEYRAAGKKAKADQAADELMTATLARVERAIDEGRAVEAFATALDVRAFTGKDGRRWRSTLERAAVAMKTHVDELVLGRKFVPAYYLSRWVAKEFPADHWSHKKVASFAPLARAYHQAMAINSGADEWKRYFHGRAASLFGAASAPKPGLMDANTPPPKWIGALCNTENKWLYPGLEGLPEFAITVTARTWCKGTNIMASKTERVIVPTQVPVYETVNIYKTVEVPKPGDFLPAGQTQRCISSKNGRCTNYATVQYRPRQSSGTDTIRVLDRQEKVLKGYKTVNQVRHVTTRYPRTITSRKTFVGFEDKAGNRTHYNLDNNGFVARPDHHEEKRAAAIESMQVQQRESLLKRTRAALGDEALAAKAAYVGIEVPGTALESRYGVDAKMAHHLLRQPPRAPFTPPHSTLDKPSPRNRADSEDYKQALETAKKDLFEAASAVQKEGRQFNDDHQEIMSGGFHDPDRYLPLKAFGIGTNIASSPLKGTDWVQTFDGHYIRGPIDVVGTLGFDGLGEASTYGLGADLRIPIEPKHEFGYAWSVGLHFMLQYGQPLEEPDTDDPYWAFLGPRFGLDKLFGDAVVATVHLSPNILQVAGSGGPAGMNRSTVLGTDVHIGLPGSFYLRVGGAAYLGAESTWNWFAGLVWKPGLLYQPDIYQDFDWKQLREVEGIDI
jgi:hypothetical protein